MKILIIYSIFTLFQTKTAKKTKIITEPIKKHVLSLEMKEKISKLHFKVSFSLTSSTKITQTEIKMRIRIKQTNKKPPNKMTKLQKL